MRSNVFDGCFGRLKPISRAVDVFRADAEIDHHRNVLFVRHVENSTDEPRVESVRVLLMAQALERAGDHAKNLAEEVCHFVSGHSLRHALQKNCRTYEQMLLQWLGDHPADRK